MILITGCGFPDLATRFMVHMLATQLKIPVLGLFDFNPFGLQILLTYKLGSMSQGMESWQYCVDIKWLGLHKQEVQELQLNRQDMTDLDTAVAKRLLNYECVKSNRHYVEQLEFMLQEKCKVEIQALYNISFDYLSTKLLRHKILKKKYY